MAQVGLELLALSFQGAVITSVCHYTRLVIGIPCHYEECFLLRCKVVAMWDLLPGAAVQCRELWLST